MGSTFDHGFRNDNISVLKVITDYETRKIYSKASQSCYIIISHGFLTEYFVRCFYEQG